MGSTLERTGKSRIIHIVALAILAAISPAFAYDGVGQWGRFETIIRNAKPYSDPYRDVTLNVTYIRPDDSKVSFWGYYDGKDAWKIRFMPDQIGTWKFDARFSDGSPGLAGTFECVESNLPGMISVDETNPMWFGFKGGKHILIRGLHIGDRFFAANTPETMRTAFLDWAGKQGYNTLSIASHYLKRDVQGRGKGWDTPKLWPLNAGEYQRLEEILNDLERRRMIVYPFAGFFGKNSNYPRDPADQELYVRYTLARLGPYWHLLFNVAGPEPNVGKGWMQPPEVIRLGKMIARLDVFGHPLAVHNRTGDDPYKDTEWSTYGILQGPKTLDLKKLSQGLLRNHHPQKPLLAQETLWSGNKFHPKYSDDNIRKNTYVIQMSATALIFADMNGDSSSGFSGSLDLADRNQQRHDIVKKVWDFMESVPWYRMKPRHDLVSQGYCLAEEGEEYLVYLESPGKVDVTLGKGPYEVRWIDAQNTAQVVSAGQVQSGEGLLTPEGGDDWLLHLKRTGQGN